jgi:hypothetical protein
MRLILIGGDGDQAWFSPPIELETVECDWFNPDTLRGRGTLVEVVSGQHVGKYVALTSQVLASIDDQLVELKQAMVVVNVVRRPGPNFRPDVYGLDAVGMGVVELAG